MLTLPVCWDQFINRPLVKVLKSHGSWCDCPVRTHRHVCILSLCFCHYHHQPKQFVLLGSQAHSKHPHNELCHSLELTPLPLGLGIHATASLRSVVLSTEVVAEALAGYPRALKTWVMQDLLLALAAERGAHMSPDSSFNAVLLPPASLDVPDSTVLLTLRCVQAVMDTKNPVMGVEVSWWNS